MKISCGDALLPSPNQNIDNHLWVVVTDPEGDPPSVVIVNLTSFRPGVDETVILHQGDHPFVRHKTVVNYCDARSRPTKGIEEALEKGLIKILDSATPQFIKRIKQGVLDSTETPPDIKEYFRKHWNHE